MVQAWEIWRAHHLDEEVTVIVVNLSPLESIPILLRDGAIVIDVPHPIFLKSEHLIKKLGILDGPLMRQVALQYLKAREAEQ